MNNIIGQLFDREQALQIQKELQKSGIEIQLHSRSHEGHPLYELATSSQEGLDHAREYFRVRMGLPGAAPAPDPQWQKIRSLKMGPVTKFLLAVSILIYLLSVFNKEGFEQLCSLFFFNDPRAPFFSSVKSGQIWRLITPIFLHFGFLHILFNGMWIKDLGAVYEKQKGSFSFIFFVVVISILSNTLQYLAMGARFGGLSGLVYGILGYLWVYGVLHQEDALIQLPRRDLYLIVGWYFLCLTGTLGHIANVAHGVGLGSGMIWGLFPLQGSKLWGKRIKYVAMALFFTIGTYAIELVKVYYR